MRTIAIFGLLLIPAIVFRAAGAENDEGGCRARVRRPGSFEIGRGSSSGTEGERNSRARDRERGESGGSTHSRREARKRIRDASAADPWLRPGRRGGAGGRETDKDTTRPS